MSLWQAPFRPPPIRSSALARPHRRYTDGNAAGFSPQPISPPDIIPLKRGYWATYGGQTIACLAVSAVSLLLMWGTAAANDASDSYYKDVVLILHVNHNFWAFESDAAFWAGLQKGHVELAVWTTLPPDAESTAASTLTYLAGATAAFALMFPLFFWSRYRKLELAFGDEMYDSEEGQAKAAQEPDSDSLAELARKQPNLGQYVDGSYVGLSALLLTVLVIGQGGAGVHLLLAPAPTGGLASPLIWTVYAVILLMLAAANAALTVACLRNMILAPQLAFQLSLVALAASLITGHWVAIGVSCVASGFLWRNHMAFKMMIARVVEPEKKDPLEAYYHNLLQLLVWVMRADGHCDRRELGKIKTTCDAMRMSSWERDFVLRSANLEDRAELKTASKRYLQSAAAAGIPDPGDHLIVVALAVAGADGVVVDQEEEAVRQLAKLVGVKEPLVDTLVGQQRLHLEALDVDRARDLLHVDSDATPDAITAAHDTLAAELQSFQYDHLGTGFASTLNARLSALTRARDLLTRSAGS
ncbi:MAG: TerB family tellurite resistance protein [bacterium]